MQVAAKNLGKTDLLTELEGSVLSEMRYRALDTAFQIRRSFAASPSLEWRGSAGSVYSAVARLEREGLIRAVAAGDGRATRRLSITELGERALVAWACDPIRAVSVGVDPFRMRAGIWTEIDAPQRAETLAGVRQAIEANIAFLETYHRLGDAIERAGVGLSLRLQKARLEWLDEMATASAWCAGSEVRPSPL